ncbi:MAG: PqiC family protein [Deltaproteobacteria bacterium]
MKRGSVAQCLIAGSLLAAPLAMASCASSPEPQFYALFPARGSTLASAPMDVQLRRPGLPSYLDRPQIVRQEQQGKLEFSGAERWGAPLDDLVGSILTQDLGQRLPNARIYKESSAISSSPDALVEVEIQRFELTENGSVELVAQVALHWPKAPAEDRLQHYALRRATRNRSTEQLVVQMSGLLAELADSIARSLHDRYP